MKYVPNEYTGKSLMMAKKKKGKRLPYKHGGYATIQDMERKCGSMTMTESAKGRKLK
tara:strand:+ start:9 stop:179 length:171 start_codon:yes stop_codon:yes gene_type:complete